MLRSPNNAGALDHIESERTEKSEVEKAGLEYHTLPIADAADLTRENVLRFDQL